MTQDLTALLSEADGDPLVLPKHQPRKALPLGELLVRSSIVGEEEIQEALKVQSEKGKRLGETLLDLGFVTEEELLPFMEARLNVQGVRLRDGLVDPAAVHLIAKPLAEHLEALALFKVRHTLTVAMADPDDLRAIDHIEKVTGLRVRAVFAFREAITRMTKRCYDEGFQVDAVTADMDEDAISIQEHEIDSISSLESIVDGSPIINLVNYLILQGIRQHASDIHIEPDRKYSVVRFRVDGQLREIVRPRRDIHPAIVSRIKVMSRMDIAEHRLPQDGRCQVVVDGVEVDLRISTLPTVLGEKVVIRILDSGRLSFNLDTLGIKHATLIKIHELLKLPHGLLLVTGPTGSGKTTTLYSALELIKSIHRNIVTVEDPVEYQLDLINQVQVDEARSFHFATALRSILRQDPDVIMVGEIRDGETAQVAIQAALTGHLVLSTLHTNDAVGAIARLMDMEIAGYKVASALVGVIAQRLVRTICENCRAPYFAPAELLRSLNYQGDVRRAFARGEGCSKCFDTGFQGRIGVYEVLTVSPKLRSLISDNAPLDDIRAQHRSEGGHSLLQEGLRLAEEEVTSLEEVIRVTNTA
jgi:type IV pilus assembly protein PilB